MWISKMLSSKSVPERAEKGSVIMNDNGSLEAGASVSSRNVGEYTPYGYQASVPVGEELLLINSTDGQVALGTKSTADGELEAGEIKISSAGGAFILLKNDGSVVINSMVIDKNGVIVK